MSVIIDGTTGITTPTETITTSATIAGVNVVAVDPSTAGNVLTSNGTAWTSATATGGGQIQYAIYTATTTWTCPTGVTKALVVCVGAGSGSAVQYGGVCTNQGYGANGGSVVAFLTVVPGTVYTVTVGTGSAGAGSISGTVTTSAGGTTSFGSLVTATGGSGASATNTTSTNGTAGTGSTTGTLLRSGKDASGTIYLIGGQTNTTTAAVVWSVSGIYAVGAGGTTIISNVGAGGIGGAVAIQYVG